MSDEMDLTSIKPRPMAEPEQAYSWARTIGMAAAIALHGGLLLRITLPPGEVSSPRIRMVEVDRPAMNLVLLDTPEPRASVVASQPLPTLRVIWTGAADQAPGASSVAESASIRVLSTAVSPPTVPELVASESPVSAAEPDAAALQAQVSDLVRSAEGPLESRATGTLPALPGRSVAFVPLRAPVKRWKQLTPERVGNVLAAMFVGTMAANPDDFEKARDARDPLREMTDGHLQAFDEPHCDDPDDPLRDRRCWDDNPNVRR